MLPLLHDSLTYQVSKPPGVCPLRSHGPPDIVPSDKKVMVGTDELLRKTTEN